MQKTCGKCKEAKDLSSFYAHKGCLYGVRPDCKECTSSEQRDKYQRDGRPKDRGIRAAYREMLDSGKAWCIECKAELPLDNFYIRKSGKQAGKPTTPRCKRHSNIHTSKIKARSYGINYDELLALQEGKCAICGSTEPGGPGRFRVDHDHSCCEDKFRSCGKCVRGLLCNRCNVAIAMFQDDPERMRNGAEYVTRRALP